MSKHDKILCIRRENTLCSIIDGRVWIAYHPDVFWQEKKHHRKWNVKIEISASVTKRCWLLLITNYNNKIYFNRLVARVEKGKSLVEPSQPRNQINRIKNTHVHVPLRALIAHDNLPELQCQPADRAGPAADAYEQCNHATPTGLASNQYATAYSQRARTQTRGQQRECHRRDRVAFF